MRDKITRKRELAARYFKARFKRQADYSEDFAQYCCTIWLRNEDTLKKSFYFLAIDFLRGNIRDLRLDGDGRGGELFTSNDRILCDKSEQRTLNGQTVSPHMNFEDLGDFKLLTTVETGVIHLWYRWGLTTMEIGAIFGHSEAWASLVHTAAIKKLRTE